MPISGGPADKLGNRYEGLWAVDLLLSILDRRTESLVMEPISPEESQGVELTITVSDGTKEYWSIKRQTTRASGWTIAALGKPDESGRSILTDLFGHVRRDVNNRAVFASTLGARDLEELRSYSADEGVLSGRLARSTELGANFRTYILPASGGDLRTARELLGRVRTHAIDEGQLRLRIDFSLRKLLYRRDGRPIDVDAVRGRLGDLLLDNLHVPLNRDTVLSVLDEQGIGLRDWAVDVPLRCRVATICESYVTPIQAELIEGHVFPLADLAIAPTVRSDNPTAKNHLVVGAAGAGKSVAVADLVRTLRSANVPVLPIRFDQLPDSILTTTELGQKLLLPDSPVAVLSGISNGTYSVLVIDQLDAISIASGRRAELWSLFDSLRREVAQAGTMSLVVGCREFDLDHDHRMRSLKNDGSGFAITHVQPLSKEQITNVVRNAGTTPESLPSAMWTILSTPLHLSMFLRLPHERRVAVSSQDELFDAYWTEAERRTNQRLGRASRWTQVLDTLAGWLSQHQQLSAPRHVLDDFSADADAMLSEHVLVLADNRVRFFHESFFDYVFARRFSSRGGQLLDLLRSGEQHLFRRAQVRQVLAFLRAHDPSQYGAELESLLSAADVRFHVKQSVLGWLSSLQDPQPQEWAILERVRASVLQLSNHVWRAIASKVPWFDVLQEVGFLDAALASNDERRRQEVIWMFALSPVIEQRPDAIASMLSRHRTSTPEWRNYLRHVCRFGDVYHGQGMFELFLSLIDDGTLDELRPGFAVNDDWWSLNYSLAKDRPDLASEAIAHWFARTVESWRIQQQSQVTDSSTPGTRFEELRRAMDGTASGLGVIFNAAKAPGSYARHMLPRISAFLAEYSQHREDRLAGDPLWSFRSFGDNSLQVHDALLTALAVSCESLAKSDPVELDWILSPFSDLPYETISFIVLRAWTAAPAAYGDRLARYLTQDQRRLKIGYSSWGGGGGSAENYVSNEAVRAAAASASPESRIQLEQTILNIQDHWEAQHPQTRGWRQFELLRAFGSDRLSAEGRARLRELERKFPRSTQEAPRQMEVTHVGPPIQEQAQARMSDENWLRAMTKYAGVEDRMRRSVTLSGGERELSVALRSRTKEDPLRFAALASKMPDDSSVSYYEAIIEGLADSLDPQRPGADRGEVGEAAIRLLRRVLRLPSRCCARAVASLIARVSDMDLPLDVLEMAVWYAIHDADPSEELWNTRANSGQPSYGGDPYTAGINSSRGAMAGTIASLLFAQPSRIEQLRPAIRHLVNDPSEAVRTCAFSPLLALCNVDVGEAIGLCHECIAGRHEVLRSPLLERFLNFTGYHDYQAVRDIIHAMLSANDEHASFAAARQVALFALTVEAASADLPLVEHGSATMRKAAAEVYATNVAHETVGATCRARIGPFLRDSEQTVRQEAAHAFSALPHLSTDQQEQMLEALLASEPDATVLEPVVRSLEDSPVRLPDLICRILSTCVDAYRDEAGDISRAGAAVAMDLSKIVVRLYAQATDAHVQSQCLNLIDQMEQHSFMGVSDELRKLDR